MTTVYITNELKTRVRNLIMKMRDNEVEAEAPTCDKDINIDASELVMQMAWGDHLHVFPQLPKDWLRRSSNETICVNFDLKENGEYENKYSFHLVGLKDFYQIPTKDHWSAPRPECSKEWLESRLHLAGAQQILNKFAEKEISTTIHKKWEKVSEDIATYLDKCKSLNEALRLWPQLQLYIPKEYIDRVNTKVERRRRADDVVSNIDMEGLTATAIAAKLSGSL